MPDIEYRFGTGQGDPNVHHSEADTDIDGDGTADGVALDFDGDGRVDDAMWDSDGDGVADTALLDLDDDGRAESAYHDPTGLGTWNAEGQGGTATQPAPSEPAPGDPPPAQPQQPDPAPIPRPDAPQPSSGEYEPYEDDGGERGRSAGDLFEGLHEDDDPTGEDTDGLFDDPLDDAESAASREDWYSDLER